MKYKIIFAVILFAASCSSKYKYPRVEIQTKLGNIVVELYNDKAPGSVASFLCRFRLL